MGGFYGEIQVRKTILLDYESATQPARSVVYWDPWWLDLLYLFIEWFCIATISIFIGETPSQINVKNSQHISFLYMCVAICPPYWFCRNLWRGDITYVCRFEELFHFNYPSKFKSIFSLELRLWWCKVWYTITKIQRLLEAPYIVWFFNQPTVAFCPLCFLWHINKY